VISIPAAARRTQEERSDETQSLLQQATLRLLLEQGYGRLTTSEVAHLAGVSKGALTHHFANKEDLVVRSIAHQLEEVTASLRRFAESGTERALGSDEIIDYLWDMMAGGLFYVTMEYLPEARHNEGFRERLVPIVRQFHEALDSIWLHLSRTSGLSPQRARVILNTTMCLIRGMVAQSVLRRDGAYYAEILAFWKTQLRAEIASAGGKRGNSGIHRSSAPRRRHGPPSRS
jgi:AcrR family transcriptional regulator